MDGTVFVWVDVPIPYPAESINSEMIAPLRTISWLPATPVQTDPEGMHEEQDGLEGQANQFATEKKGKKGKHVRNKGRGRTIGKGKIDGKAHSKEPVPEDDGHFARSQSHLQSREFEARRNQHLQWGQRSHNHFGSGQQWQSHRLQDQWQDGYDIPEQQWLAQPLQDRWQDRYGRINTQ